MIPTVVVCLFLVTSTLSHPLIIQQHPQSEIGQIEKTGVETSEYYTPTGQTTHTEQQVEKTGQENTVVPKVENVPVNVEQPQQLYPQNPVLLPVQPLSVVPFNPTGQVLRPIVVPAEAIADGRVIITPIGSIQQRNFHQDVFVIPQSQQQEVVHPTYTTAQTQLVEQVEKQTGVQQEQTSQEYNQQVVKQTPVQQEFQQTSQDVKQTSQEYTEQQVVKQTVPYQTEPVVTNTDEKQAETTVQVESKPQVYNVQEVQTSQAYTGEPVVVLSVKNQAQQPQVVEKQAEGTTYTQQQGYSHGVEKQTAAEYVPVQSQPEQQVYSVQSEQTVHQQVYNVQPEQPVQQQVYSVQPEQPVHQQVYNVQPEQPVEQQQQVYSVQPEQTVHQQQVVPEQVETNVPYHPSEQILKTSEVEPNQQYINVQPQQVATYVSEPVHNFGDKLPQVQHTLQHTQQQTVASTQE